MASAKKKKAELKKNDQEIKNVEIKEGVVRTFFDPANPRHENAWTDLYNEYLERIKKENYGLFETIEGFHKQLADDPKMRIVFLLFKKIVPTIDPSDISPLEFLRDSISDVKKHKDYNKLCIFVLITTLKLKELEERIMKNRTFDHLSLNKKDYDDINILHPLFTSILKEGIGFSKGYNEIIVPKLVEHKNYLLRSVENCIKNIEKCGVSKKKEKLKYEKNKYKIIDLYEELNSLQDSKNTKKIQSTKNNIITNIFEIDALKKNFFHNKFYDWKGGKLKKALETTINNSDKELYVIFSSSKLMIPTSFVESFFWSPLSPWPINEYLNMFSNKTDHSAMDEIWMVIPL